MNEILAFFNNYYGVINVAIIASLFGLLFKLCQMSSQGKDAQIELLRQQIDIKNEFTIENLFPKYQALSEYHKETVEELEESVREWKEESFSAIQREKNEYAANKLLAEELDIEATKRRELLERFKSEKEKSGFSKINLSANEVCGEYYIIGHNPQPAKSTYVGKLEITNENNTYFANWVVGPNKQKHRGVGVLIGTTIAFTYTGDMNHLNMPPQIGVVLYEFLSEEILRGKWTISFDNQEFEDRPISLGYEECRKL